MMTVARRYLVVDDNQPLAENLAEILETSGAEVDVELDSRVALGRLQARRYTALVTDMRMPGLGGAELLAAARLTDPGLPALVVTAFIGDADLARVERMGVLATLPKPIPVEILLLRLEQARRGAVVWVVSGTSDRLTRVMEFVRDHGCTPAAPDARTTRRPRGPTPLLAVLAATPDAEAEAWAARAPGRAAPSPLTEHARGPGHRARRAAGAIRGGWVSQGRILLVDDNVDLVDNLGEILEDEGYKVLRATSAATARARAAEGFDVALVDLRLPDGDGTELAAELHRSVPGAEVVLLTGFASVESAAAAIRAGACAYLVKPCAVPELLLTVGQALRQVRLQAEREELSRRAQLAEKLATVGRLTAGLSHEIRNPLNAAALQLSVLERRIRKLPEEGQPPLLEPLVLVRDEIRRLDQTLQDFLLFSRPRELVRRAGPARRPAARRWPTSCPATPRPGWSSWWSRWHPAPRRRRATRACCDRCC